MITSVYQQPLDKWFSEFLPGKDGENLTFEPEDLPEDFRNRPFHFDDISVNPTSEKYEHSEKDLYSLLCPVIQNAFDLAAYKSAGDPEYDALLIKDTSAWNEESDCLQCPDLSVHKASAAQAFRLDDSRKANFADTHKPFVGRTAYSWTLLPGEVKVNKSKEGFGLNTDQLSLPDTDSARETRGQIAEYVAEVLSRQHRQFTFAFYIYRNLARLFVVDRVATVTTPPFDYVKDPKTLLKFFYRLAQADGVAQGYDPTVTLAPSAHLPTLREHMAKDHGPIETLIHDAMDDALLYGASSIWPLYTVEVHDDESDEKSYFLIGKPRTSCPSMFGRATKGFIAFDLVQHDFVWLKDSWRLASQRYHPEWEVYRKLNAKGVKNIATMRCGGDVHAPKLQCTRTQEAITDHSLKSRIHCRLVINEIGRPLGTYETSYDLIFIIACAFKAHSQAWEMAEVLHRDISDNNVLIIQEKIDGKYEIRGILIDWDLCKYKKQLEEDRVATNDNQSGTWQFISALRLQYPRKFCELADDIESFFHLITWCALRYHQHSLLGKPRALTMHVNDMFLDCATSPEGLLYGCEEKFRLMTGSKPGFKILHDETFKDVINKLLRICQSHYRSLDWDDLRRFQAASIREAQEEKKSQAQTTSTTSHRRRLQKGLSGMPEGTVSDDDEPDNLNTEQIGRPKLASHKYFFRVLDDAIRTNDGWDLEPKQLGRDNFADLLDLNFTVGRLRVTGTTQSNMTSSQRRKRSAPVHTSRKIRKTGTCRHAVSMDEGRMEASLTARSEEDAN
ncbi:unnamed protein product [Somion occarium]|uniref:Fungal-type protein kinase domain-containing protein n=1 Tax=Somion occarium TaxID=3059160 RepID=A0ABP1E560_9APHY